MPLITVRTAAKNAAALLPETIASIQGQTVRDWRYVIVDDGSTDDTAEVAARFARDDARIEVVRLAESVGPYAAANVGARDAASAYIARIDGDDVARPNRFEVQLEALRAHPRARGCTGAVRRLYADGAEPQPRRVPSHHNGVIKWMLWFRNCLVHSTLLIATETFHSYGGYGPARVGEDFRVWSSLVRANALVVVDEELVLYRFHAGQITADDRHREQPERWDIWRDHMQACAPGDWTREDARDFHYVGEAAPFPPQRALALIDRFERAWQADGSLTADERTELARHTAKRRLRHLRHAVGSHPAAVPFATVRSATSVARAFATVMTTRGVPWP